jgi:hypothetical protein
MFISKTCIVAGFAGACVACAGALQAQVQSMAEAGTSLNQDAKFLLSGSRVTSDNPSGFLSGLRGFEQLTAPVGNPLYFEDPVIATEAKLLFLRHSFGDDSQLQGGEVTVAAVQLRLAISERLAIIATKDGYSWLNADALPEEDGWNSLAAGLKYAFYVDRAEALVASTGFRYETKINGESKVLQGDVDEVSPFVCFAKGWGAFTLSGNVTARVPLDQTDGNNIVQWDLSAAYEVSPGISPLIEVHGLHYLDDADRTPLSVGGYDYTNLGSQDVSGSTVVSLGAGARIKFSPNVSLGALYEFALTNKDADIMDQRLTVDLVLRY